MFFPVAYSGSPHPGSSLLLFIVGSLGKNAWLLFSQTDPACRGQDGTTSFSKFAPSRSIESCFLLDQASVSRAVSGQPRPPSPQPLPRGSSILHPRLSWGAGSVPCWRWVGASVCHPPGWLHLPTHGGVGTTVSCMALTGRHCTGIAACSHSTCHQAVWHLGLSAPARFRSPHGAPARCCHPLALCPSPHCWESLVCV